MKRVITKSKCTGCTACVNICPKRAIEMKTNKKGFLYPIINEEKCVDCGLCKSICPILKLKNNNSINKCYVGYAKDNAILEKSSSGGLFTVFANYVLSSNGIVIGAGFDENNKLVHQAIVEKSELNKIRGSKYLQSNLGNIFEYIKNNISNKKILFVGVPCQIAGLKSFLKTDYDNLICVDLICHGVPSPKVFDKYIKELEKKYNEKLISYNFRDKSTGWDTYSNTAIFKDNIKSELQTDNKYMKIFLSDVALRTSCYRCQFKLGNKYSDITLGDFWGVKNCYPEMYNEKGVSAIIINTEKGKKSFSLIKKEIDFKECSIFEIVKGNPYLKESVSYNKYNNSFFRKMDSFDFNDLVSKYGKKKKRIYIRVFNLTKRIFKRIIKNKDL